MNAAAMTGIQQTESNRLGARTDIVAVPTGAPKEGRSREGLRAKARATKEGSKEMKQPTKLQAVLDIIRDARTERSSKASLKRLRRAGQSLELTEDEQCAVEAALDYRPTASEGLYQFYLREG